MMDMSVAGGAAPVEAPSAKPNRPGGKDDSSRNGGFSDVLAKTGDTGQAADTASDTANTPAGTEGADDTIDRNLRNRSHPKPVIDLSDASLKEQVAVKPETVAIPTTVKEKLSALADQADGESAKNGSEKLAEEIDLHVKKNAKPAKPGDTSKAADQDDSDAAADVLGLLKKEVPEAPLTVAVAMQGHVKGRDDDAPGNERDTAGTKANGDAHAVDALSAIQSAAEGDTRVPGTEAAEPTDGKTFRLSRADGRGESMDIHIGNDGDGAEGVKTKGDMENVTVLESRRYLGLAQNSTSVTAAIAGDKDWAQAMQPSSALSNAAEWTSTGKVVNTLKIQMTPIDLGLVTATMRLSGDTLNVDLKVETGSAYRQLKEDHGKILEALRSQGFAVDNITISMAPVEKPDAGNQANAQSQSGQQQSLQQGQGGEARERQSQGAQRGNGGFNDAGETGGVEDAASGTARSGVSGGVYL